MIEVGGFYKLLHSIKGWPVEDAGSLEEASRVILGSPYWDIPVDCYRVLDMNDTYSLIAVNRKGKVSRDKRYLAVNVTLIECIRPIDEDYPGDDEDCAVGEPE
jgi:hypothetical protein